MTDISKSIRDLCLEADEHVPPSDRTPAVRDVEQPETPEPNQPSARSCPDGFVFDGKHCVPDKKQNAKKEGEVEGDEDAPPDGSAPPPRKGDEEGEFPATRHFANKDVDKDIPLVPDPQSEVMRQPHNAITYANGKRSFEHADVEYSEYAHNAFVQAKFPDAFTGKGDFVSAFLNGKHLFVDDWSTVQNCSASQQKPGDFDGLVKTLWNFKEKEWMPEGGDTPEEFKDYVDGLVAKAEEEDPETTPPVIIGTHTDPLIGKETDYLLSGNSRALVYAFLGKPAPVRSIPLKGRMLPDPSDAELQNVLWPAERSSDNDDEVEANIKQAIQQVMQQRETTGAQESVMATLKNVFTESKEGSDSNVPFPSKPKRKYPSGYLKRQFRKAYAKLGYPVGTVRNWAQGKMIKTPNGWEPAGGEEKASPAVPAAGTDTPESPKKQPGSKKLFHINELDPSSPSSEQDPSVFERPKSAVNDDGHWIEHIPGFPHQTTDRHYSGWKKPKDYRQKLHSKVLDQIFNRVAPVKPDEQPVAIMLMGGPASGKSTIGSSYPDDQFVHLDADALKDHIPEYKVAVKWRAKNAAKMAHEESIHMMQQLRERTIASRKNLVMDGSGRHLDSYLRMISDLHKAGYHVKVVMSHVDKETAKRRAHVRGKKTGRWVPDNVFDEAYEAIPSNFKPISKAADDFEMWDTSADNKAKLVWSSTDGNEVKHDPDFVNKFEKDFGRDRWSSSKLPNKP